MVKIGIGKIKNKQPKKEISGKLTRWVNGDGSSFEYGQKAAKPRYVEIKVHDVQLSVGKPSMPEQGTKKVFKLILQINKINSIGLFIEKLSDNL